MVSIGFETGEPLHAFGFVEVCDPIFSLCSDFHKFHLYENKDFSISTIFQIQPYLLNFNIRLL